MFRFTAVLVMLIVAASMAHAQGTVTIDGSHRMRYIGWDAGLWGGEGSPVQCLLNRTRVGVTWRPTSALELRAAMMNEFTNWIDYPTDREFTFDEIVFEHLFARWHDTLGIPFEAKIGRQDMRLGDGFLIMDGSPLDGSRSLYVNAGRLDLEPWPRQRLTLLYLHQPTRDDLLPIINDRARALAEYTRRIWGVYFSGTPYDRNVDAYILASRGPYKPWQPRGGENPIEPGDVSALTTGVRIDEQFSAHWRLRAEAAYQRSERQMDARGSIEMESDQLGFHADLGWSSVAADATDPGKLAGLAVRAGFFSYAFDWEPLLGRWPMWNESVAFSRGILEAPAYWSDIRAPFLEFSVQPLENLRLVAGLQQLERIQRNAFDEASGSLQIGHLLTLWLFWKPVPRLAAHLMVERMWYSDAYLVENNFRMPNSYFWGRVEVLYTLPGWEF
jgi:hypothetical protein